MKLTMEHPVFQFLNTACSFIALNLLFLITCLPVFTIGAAVSSLYYVMLGEARGEERYLIKPYLREFRRSFRTKTLAFLLLLVIGLVLIFNLAFWTALGSIPGLILTFVVALGTCVYLLTALFTFPLIARFENGLAQTLKNALLIALSNRRMTLLLLMTNLMTILACLFFPQAKLFMLLIGFAFITYCQSFLFTRVFSRYEQASS